MEVELGVVFGPCFERSAFPYRKNIVPGRLSAIGCGEYRPVASNDDPVGRQKNRRVEIIILPRSSKVENINEG